MRTSSQMVNHTRMNGLGKSLSKREDVKNFKEIERLLEQGEDVITCFIGLHNWQTMAKHEGMYAYAVTKERLIYSKKTMFNTNIGEVRVRDITDIHLEEGNIYGTLRIETRKDVLEIGVDNVTGNNIYNNLKDNVNIKGLYIKNKKGIE